MAIDFRDVVTRGGADLIQFMEYCVMSVYVDPIFVFLVSEYRHLATTRHALALYDVFCHPQATSLISARTALSPYDRRLEGDIEVLRANKAEVEAFNATDPEFRESVRLPPRYLFDYVEQSLLAGAENTLDKAAQQFDPSKTPLENLPGGEMNEAQRYFVEHVWRPHVRPYLVNAGFRRVQNVG